MASKIQGKPVAKPYKFIIDKGIDRSKPADIKSMIIQFKQFDY